MNEKVSIHYSADGALAAKIASGLRENGLEPGDLNAADLEYIDEFHFRGRAATLVTFSDLNDLTTARVVPPDRFQAVFEPGVRFKRAIIQMVSPGRGDEPVTRGIEDKIPGLLDEKSWNAKLNKLPFDRNRLTVGSRALNRE